MRYKVLKYLGCAGWAFTYVCFVAIAYNYHWCMIPLVVCAYNISYEFLYTTLATDKGQRLRNGIWFGLDMFVIYSYIKTVSVFDWFLFWVSIMLAIQIVLNLRISKELTKSFAWVTTLVMAVLLIYNPPPFYSNWVVLALIGKILGDGFYGLANGFYGIPGVNRKSLYGRFLLFTIIGASVFNLIALYHYVTFFK